MHGTHDFMLFSEDYLKFKTLPAARRLVVDERPGQRCARGGAMKARWSSRSAT
jgi:hypothetical protein